MLERSQRSGVVSKATPNRVGFVEAFRSSNRSERCERQHNKGLKIVHKTANN